MHDREGVGGPVYLVSDPTRFLTDKLLPTSDFDRALHFWPDEANEAILLDALRAATLSSPLITRLIDGADFEPCVQPSEVDALLTECDTLVKLGDRRLYDSIAEIRSIALAAKSYRLGICLLRG
jgi:hypothetical protein